MRGRNQATDGRRHGACLAVWLMAALLGASPAFTGAAPAAAAWSNREARQEPLPPATQPSETAGPATPPGGEAGDLPLQQIDQGRYSGLETRSAWTITTPEVWATLWGRIQAGREPQPAPPVIDFGATTVVAVALGERSSGGHGIEIGRVVDRGSVVAVLARETTPGRDCATTAALSQPYHIVAFPRQDKPLVYEVESLIVDCAGPSVPTRR